MGEHRLGNRRNITAGAILVLALCLIPIALRNSLRQLSNKNTPPEEPPTRFLKARVPNPGREISAEQAEQIAALNSLPYVAGSSDATEFSGVTIHDAQRAWAGLNVYNSGHTPEAVVMDMDGRVLHRWHFPIEQIWPDRVGRQHSGFWRRVHCYPNGDLLAIFGGVGLLKLDRDSNLLWSYRGGCHHQACVTEDGTIYVLTMRTGVLPRLRPDEPIIEDMIAVLEPDGILRAEYSLLECFENSDYADLLDKMLPQSDVFHTNSIRVFDGSQSQLSPKYAKGNVLISVLYLDAVAIVNLEHQTVVWAATGQQREPRLWHRQHDPRLLPNGNMLLFDNLGRPAQSHVLEFEPETLDIVWRYPPDADTRFVSDTCGTAQRLPNGNTLITESDNGRAIEVTAEGKTVWEFYNPNRAGENNELVATLFEMIRLPADYFPWLEEGE